MITAWKNLLVKIGRALAHPKLWSLLCSRRARYIISWLMALGIATTALTVSWILFNNDDATRRSDGNAGHCTVDFGGQYLMGRMLLLGHGRHLYDRVYQRQVLWDVYPQCDEDPGQERSDVENLMSWLMGDDDPQVRRTIGSFLLPLSADSGPSAIALLAPAKQLWQPPLACQAARITVVLAAADPIAAAALLVRGQHVWESDRIEQIAAKQCGGALYPPINAFLFYPLTLLTPHLAYRASQLVSLFLALVAGLGITRLSHGRIWLPVAISFVIAFPGFVQSMELGQNAALTFAILIWGWVLIAEDRQVAGGVLWGLLAFKPVWIAAFFLVPLLTGRWRVCATMLITGGTLALLTVPVVGIEGWQDWLQVGREGAETYTYDQNWIELSRDLLSLPRKWLDFDSSWRHRRDAIAPTIVGWCLLVLALELTVRIAVLRRRECFIAGSSAAFLLAGAWLCCFHFMYYDVLLAALPFIVVLDEPRRFLNQKWVAVVPVPGLTNTASNHDAQHPASSVLEKDSLPYGPRHLWVLNAVEPTLWVAMLATVHVLPLFGLGLRAMPYDTFCVALLWLWCGWQLMRRPQSAESFAQAAIAPSDDSIPRDGPGQLRQLGANVGRAH